MTKPKQTQPEKFRKAAKEAGTDSSEEHFDATLKNLAKASRGTPPDGGYKVCPECPHVFQGNGWDGIDAHWKAKHETIMPYVEAWPLIKAGKYQETNKP
jgi:hypothetical protein